MHICGCIRLYSVVQNHLCQKATQVTVNKATFLKMFIGLFPNKHGRNLTHTSFNHL